MSARIGLAVLHETGFTYDGDVTSSYNEARMTPRTANGQVVRRAAVTVEPASSITTYRDYFGTVVSTFDIQERHDRLVVSVSSDIESWAPALDEPVTWAQLDDPRLADRLGEYLAPTVRTAVPDDAADELRGLRDRLDPHGFAEAVAERVLGRISYVPGATTVEATARDAWRRGEGVCQDITHVMIGLLRGAGLPARYVSGYLWPQLSPEVDETVVGESHAWVEYFAGTWTGIDPTNGQRETERHIVVGSGRDYDDVAPLRGVYQGPRSTGLGVRVELRRTS